MVLPRYRCSWDDIAYLDADHMAGWGAFVADKRETIDFDEDYHPAIGYEMEGDASFLAVYRWQHYGSGPSDDFVTTRVRLDRRPCRFGGRRVYFICPRCPRRTLRLAVLPEGLRCGTCGHVTWGSRREGEIRRLIRRGNKLAMRLGTDGWSSRPEKRPAHMRETTYQRLASERARLAAEIDRRLSMRLGRAGLLARTIYIARL